MSTVLNENKWKQIQWAPGALKHTKRKPHSPKAREIFKTLSPYKPVWLEISTQLKMAYFIKAMRADTNVRLISVMIFVYSHAIF